MPTQLTIPQRPQYGVGQFEPFSAFGGLVGLRFAWESSFGAMLPALDEAFTPLVGGGGIGITPPPQGPITFFNTAGNIALHNVGKGLTNTQHAHVQHHVQHAFLFDGFATAIKNAAAVQVHAKHHVDRKTHPRKVIEYIKTPAKVNLKPLRIQVEAAAALARKDAQENIRLRKRVKTLEHEVAHLKRHAPPITAPTPGIDLPGWGEIRDRLKNPSKWLGLAAFLALLAKALPKLGVNYIRCRENKRWGAHVCRNGYDFLSNLIAATSLIIGIWSLLDFAKTMQAGVSDVVTATKSFWGVTDRVLAAVLAEADPTINMDWRVS